MKRRGKKRTDLFQRRFGPRNSRSPTLHVGKRKRKKGILFHQKCFRGRGRGEDGPKNGNGGELDIRYTGIGGEQPVLEKSPFPKEGEQEKGEKGWIMCFPTKSAFQKKREGSRTRE